MREANPAATRLSELQTELDAMSDDVLDKATIDLARSISVAQTRLAIHVREAEHRNMPEERYGLGTTGWLRHTATMTAAQASGTFRKGRALDHMLNVTERALAGDIPHRSVRLLAQAYDRHRDEFGDHEEVFADVGTYLSVKDLQRSIDHWEQQINYHDAMRAAHKRDQLRAVYHHQTLGGLWATKGTFTPEGCHAPSSWCDVHHNVHWADGGDTSLANCQLLCRRHHTATHADDNRSPPDL